MKYNEMHLVSLSQAIPYGLSRRRAASQHRGWRSVANKKRKSINKFFSVYLSKIKLPQIKRKRKEE